MDYWASLEHKIYYKFEGNAPTHISKELKECADIVTYLDEKMLSINNEVENYKTPLISEKLQEREKFGDGFILKNYVNI